MNQEGLHLTSIPLNSSWQELVGMNPSTVDVSKSLSNSTCWVSVLNTLSLIFRGIIPKPIKDTCIYSAGRQPQTTFYLILPAEENTLQNAGEEHCWLRQNIFHPGTRMAWNCLACREKIDIASLDGMEVATGWQPQKNICLKCSIFNVLGYKKNFWESAGSLFV